MVALQKPEQRSGQFFDPTKNVEDLVRALETTLEKLRIADTLRIDDLRLADTRRTDDLSAAESKRIDDLRQQREICDKQLDELRSELRMLESKRADDLSAQRALYEKQIADIKADNEKLRADILSAQTERSAVLLADQLNKVTERVASVEKNQYVTGGRTSVSDPALADAMKDLATLKRAEGEGVGSKSGQAQMGTLINAAVLIVIAIAAIAIPFLVHR